MAFNLRDFIGQVQNNVGHAVGDVEQSIGQAIAPHPQQIQSPIQSRPSFTPPQQNFFQFASSLPGKVGNVVHQATSQPFNPTPNIPQRSPINWGNVMQKRINTSSIPIIGEELSNIQRVAQQNYNPKAPPTFTPKQVYGAASSVWQGPLSEGMTLLNSTKSPQELQLQQAGAKTPLGSVISKVAFGDNGITPLQQQAKQGVPVPVLGNVKGAAAIPFLGAGVVTSLLPQGGEGRLGIKALEDVAAKANTVEDLAKTLNADKGLANKAEAVFKDVKNPINSVQDLFNSAKAKVPEAGLSNIGNYRKFVKNAYQVATGQKNTAQIAKIRDTFGLPTDTPEKVVLRAEAFDQILSKHPDKANVDFNKALGFVKTLNFPETISRLPEKQRINFINKVADNYLNVVGIKPVIAKGESYVNTSFLTGKIKKYSEGLASPSSPVGVGARLPTSDTKSSISQLSNKRMLDDFLSGKINDVMPRQQYIESRVPQQPRLNPTDITANRSINPLANKNPLGIPQEAKLSQQARSEGIVVPRKGSDIAVPTQAGIRFKIKGGNPEPLPWETSGKTLNNSAELSRRANIEKQLNQYGPEPTQIKITNGESIGGTGQRVNGGVSPSQGNSSTIQDVLTKHFASHQNITQEGNVLIGQANHTLSGEKDTALFRNAIEHPENIEKNSSQANNLKIFFGEDICFIFLF